MAIAYKVVTIEDFEDNAATEAALNVEGADDWILTDVVYGLDDEGKAIATCIFRK